MFVTLEIPSKILVVLAKVLLMSYCPAGLPASVENVKPPVMLIDDAVIFALESTVILAKVVERLSVMIVDAFKTYSGSKMACHCPKLCR